MGRKSRAITPVEAAAIIGKSPQYVRVGLQQGVLNIGECVKMSSIYTYSISPALLAARQGLTIEQLDQQLERLRA